MNSYGSHAPLMRLPEEIGKGEQTGGFSKEEDSVGPFFEHLVESLHEALWKCSTLPVMATSWMHAKHPVHPVQKELMLEQVGASRNMYEVGRLGGWVLGQVARCMRITANLTLSLLRLRWRFRREIGLLKRQPFDIVAKTWCFGPQHRVDNNDFYYGDLQRRLQSRGVRMLVLCGDPRGPNREICAGAHISTSGICRLPELCLVNPLAPIWMAFKQMGASLRLRVMKLCERNQLMRRIYALASRDCLSPTTAYNGLFFWISRKAVETWRPTAFMTLYEGHAWEKCALWGAKAADPSCKTVGYQHTVLFPESLSVTRPYAGAKQRLVPDVVLSLGQVTQELMRAGHERHNSRLVRFGSFRRREPFTLRPPNPSTRTVLVTPEGMVPETTALFTFAYECARTLPFYTFILRTHPELSVAKALEHLSVDIMNQPNIKLSDAESIEEDFKKASVLLYRGSSSVLYAILNGLMPVYLHVENMLDTDPLYALECWRKTCSTSSEFSNLVERYEQTPLQHLVLDWQSAAKYVQSYAEPVEEKGIEEFLAAAGIEGDRPR